MSILSDGFDSHADFVTTFAAGPDQPSDTVVRQTDFHVIIGQRVVFDMNLARAILSRRETLSDGEVKACVLP